MEKKITPQELEIKEAKNELASNLKKFPGVFKPYGLANALVGKELFKGIYGKSLNSINNALTSLGVDFTSNEIFKFMDDEHIEVVKCAINDLTEYVSYKEEISYDKLKTDLFEMAYICGLSARNALKEKLGKRISLYNDLLKKVSKKYTDELLEETYLESAKNEKFALEQQQFLETEAMMYHDEFSTNLLENDENKNEGLRVIHR